MMRAEATSQKAEQLDLDDVVLGGSPVPPLVLPGHIDPRSWHYFYSAGERELRTRAADVGYTSITPGRLVPLRPFPIRVPNDTVESLYDENAPRDRKIDILPMDQADALMSRYQHRGCRILFPLTGMEGADGLNRAARLFNAVHPKIVCPRSPKLLTRQCVFCRLEELESEACFDRMAKSVLKAGPDIPYGLTEDGALRFIDEEEALTIIHGLILTANQEHMAHMIDTLQQSKADVEAGRMGPGKKKFDKRDDWYFLNAHATPEQIQAIETVRDQSEPFDASSIGTIVSQTLKAVRENESAPVDVVALLAEQKRQFDDQLAQMGKQFEAKLKLASKGKTDTGQ